MEHPHVSYLRKYASFVQALALGFDGPSTVTLPRPNELCVKSCEIKGAKTLRDENQSRAISNEFGQGSNI
ncbi:uncharacterized protein J3R85_001239 [Psidium guajava]|nr:uncharacterized protein J3R85_001239 [Psidium guajava]